jgi:hypothetical protein
MSRPRRITPLEWARAEASWLPLWLTACAAAYLLSHLLRWTDGSP